ncbi:MAG: ATP-binding protein [Myxococcota bacterium]
MSFLRHVESRYAHTLDVLGLSATAGRVLHALILLDLEGSENPDVHGRQGIIAWNVLVDRMAGDVVSVSEVEDALIMLANWGLVQVVGQTYSDPRLTGASALRLTHAGRVCTGLAPYGAHEPEMVEGGWEVLHHANREGLVVHAVERVGAVAWRPIMPTGDKAHASLLCGEVAIQMVMHGAAVIDGFSLGEAERKRELPLLMWRTREARALRILLLPTPMPVRAAAVAVGATLRWTEPALDPRREGNDDMDKRVTDRLMDDVDNPQSIAHACGVPRSNLARPRRVDVGWDDLIVDSSVKLQIDQAMKHADFRLNILPNKSTFIGKGGGYRLLLSGLPGTGKSLMAEALATRLHRTVVKLDLSTVLSKWLGETEQLIGQIFDLAEASNSVLVLDEAEALFRQRQGGNSSAGGNALLTAVAYLLTRLDRYEGVLVATTNRTQDLDDALYRRFDDFIILPVPNPETRERLWRRMLMGGLKDAEKMGDEDFKHLGKHFAITGGLIRGAAIRASAWAAGDDTSIAMPYVLASLARELEKSDHPTGAIMIEPYRADVARLLQDKRYPYPFASRTER